MDKTEIFIVVAGEPKPKGSVSGFPIQRRGGGTGVNIVHSSKSKHWESLVRDQLADKGTVAGAVAVEIHFMLPKPISTKRLFPEVFPDLDKLVRATLDALQRGAIADDKQVCDINTTKRYSPDGFVGAYITIRRLDPEDYVL